MQIRVAYPEDIPAIILIAKATWPVAYKEILSKEQLTFMLDIFYNENILRQQMKEGRHFILSVLPDGTITGYASYGKAEGSTDSYHLHKLYVLPEFQKNHCGKNLLQYIIKDAIRRGINRLSLNVNRHNKAIRFYEKMGFTISHSEDISIGNGFFMNDYIMVKSLG